jgi:hypothetical protein
MAITVVIRQPTFDIAAKDVGFPYPFATNPHLLITRKYSSSTVNKHELVFRHVFPHGQGCRTAAHTPMRQRLGINLLFTDAIGDTNTLVTRKTEK